MMIYSVLVWRERRLIVLNVDLRGPHVYPMAVQQPPAGQSYS